MANEVTLTGFVNNVKKLNSGINVGTLAVSTKVSGKNEEAKYKNGFINIISKLPLPEGKKVDIKGFITFDFYEDKVSGKEKNSLKIFVNEIN